VKKRFFVVLFFLQISLIAKQEEVISSVSHSYEYDQYKNPIKLTIITTQTKIPVINNQSVFQLQEVYRCTQELSIQPDGNLQEIGSCCQDIGSTIDLSLSHKNQNISHSLLDQYQSGLYVDARLVPHDYSAFECMSNQDLFKAILYNRYCKIHYQMKSTEKINFMN
jgi:hypothetical protein